ncbi:hypothetical protein [Citrobacter portucalensis]|uniref:hypothetical protein n=1 Tax=Citrobacter portucalensis TaxID=1639133 RepID=UPI001C7DB6E7|nr:hypothetical protein [Citrobacter portucalensis]
MTNNHPAHGPISLDRLHQIRETLSKASAQSDGGNLGYAMADAVKVIDGAIAAFGAEPAPVDIEMLATVLRNAPLAPSDSQGKPRAPVVPEECKEAPAYVKALTKEGAYIYGFNACRAAMLQAGKYPVTPDGWQLVPKEPTEAMNKAGWAAMNEHDAINPTYRAMLAAAPQQDVRLALEIGMSRYAGAMQKLVDSGD